MKILTRDGLDVDEISLGVDALYQSIILPRTAVFHAGLPFRNTKHSTTANFPFTMCLELWVDRLDEHV